MVQQRTRWSRFGTLLALCIVLSIGAYLRLDRLESFPPALHVDEAASAVNGLEVVDGERPLLGYGFTNHLNTAFLLPGVVLKLFGASVWNLRSVEAAFGIAAVLLTYLLGRTLFSWRVGLAAATLLAVNHFAVAFSRIGLVNQQSMTLELLAFWLLWEGSRRNNRSLMLAGGAAAGLGLYLYFGSWIVPLILCVFLLWAGCVHKHALHRRRGLGLWAALGFGLVFLPWLAFPLMDAGGLQQRPTEVFMLSNLEQYKTYWETDSLLRVIWLQTLRTVGVFVVGRDTSNQYGYDAPLFFSAVRPFFFIGIIAVVVQLRRAPQAFVLIWLTATLVVGGILTDSPPFMPRLLGMLPAAMLIATLGLVTSLEALAWLARQARRLPWSWRGLAILPRVNGVSFLAALGVLALFSFGGNYEAYFKLYPKTPYTIWWPWIEPMSSIGRYLQAHPGASQVYLFQTDDGYVQVSKEHPILQFYGYTADVTLTNIVCQHEECAIPAPAASGQTIYVLPEGTLNLLPRLEQECPGGAAHTFVGHRTLDGERSEHFAVYVIGPSAQMELL